MAEGLEDTTFYIYKPVRFSLNEVGGEPQQFGRRCTSPINANAEHLRSTGRRNMLATSTHDTKRSEDVRARIDISAIPRDGARR